MNGPESKQLKATRPKINQTREVEVTQASDGTFVKLVKFKRHLLGSERSARIPVKETEIQAQVHYDSSAKNLDSPMIEGEQLNSDLVKQKKTCSSDYINVETEIGAFKKIPDALNQGGAENNHIEFDETKDEKNATEAILSEAPAQGGAEKGAQRTAKNVLKVVPVKGVFRTFTGTARFDQQGSQKFPNDAKYCQTLPTSGSEMATTEVQGATSGTKTAVSTKQLAAFVKQMWTSGSSAVKRQLRAVKLPFPPNNCGVEQEGCRERSSEAQKYAGEGDSPLDQEVREREVT